MISVSRSQVFRILVIKLRNMHSFTLIEANGSPGILGIHRKLGDERSTPVKIGKAVAGLDLADTRCDLKAVVS